MSKTTEAFLENWINGNHSLLGRKLQPLCLRHLLWLYAVKSPLIFTDRPVTMADLEIAAIVCGSRNDSELTFLHAQEMGAFARFRERLWRRSNKRRDLKAETIRFLGYQEDYCRMPETYEGDAGKGESPLPWMLTNAAALISNTGWTEETVFNLPLGKLFWMNYAFGYLKTGETPIMGDSDIAARDALQGTPLTK